MVRRHAKRNARVADLPFRAHESLRERRLRDEKRTRDLVRLQAGHLAERQRDLRLDGERRVAAREDEAEPVVGDRAHVLFLFGAELFEPREELRLACERALPADPVDRAVARRRDDPCSGLPRDAVSRPALERCRERVLHRVLGKVEVAEDADEDRDGMSPFLAEEGVDR
jgi:hypothetical protein